MEVVRLELGALSTNCYLVHREQGTIVIDPAADAGAILDALKQRGWTADAVVLTHAHFDHMLGELQHVERIRKFSLQTNENKTVCASHTHILEALLHGDLQEVSDALESHLSRYKVSVEEAKRVHPDYITEG